MTPAGRQFNTAGGEEYQLPATIDDPAILREIAKSVQQFGLSAREGGCSAAAPASSLRLALPGERLPKRAKNGHLLQGLLA